VAPCVSAVSIRLSRYASAQTDAGVAPSNTSIEYHALTGYQDTASDCLLNTLWPRKSNS
jgi:hypothetical protein